MKKINFKRFSITLFFCFLGITTVYASNKILSAKYKDTKVTLDDKIVLLENSLVVVGEDETNSKIYVPAEELLQRLGYRVDWDKESNTVCLKSSVRVDGDVIVKHVVWYKTVKNNFIELEEDLQTSSKWQLSSIDKKDITLVDDKYISLDSSQKNKKNIHRFNFSFPIDTNTSKASITFEKMLDGKKTGAKIIYEIDLVDELATIIDDQVPLKPVIYLYPTKKTDVKVSIDYDGGLFCTYPAYNNGWSVSAYPDGKLINHSDNKEYSYLFWEGDSPLEYDFSKGFVVKGEDTVSFLQEKLIYMGLTPKEYNEFIVYWLPQMQNNPYNFITFQKEAYTEHAELQITPAPDSLLRIFMAYKPLNTYIDVKPQQLDTFDRKGFSVVEWGGAVVK